ncbi:MAG: DoxX family protein [Desulfobacterales bacterium CG23_combo_of_CG06-09_8_20_14_all_51_8]|nr:MAG: DoxX family protein [Desulfobacterales bacterium CG23_combo_of_CG06-09_8_20_14_all_51_8]
MNKLNWIKINRKTAFLVRLVLGAILIAAGIPKILDTVSFAGMVYNYQILPDQLINLTALFLPWLEVLVGVLMITGVWLPGAVILYNGLMLAFIAALSFNIYRGVDISCGCFSTSPGESIDMGTVLRDVVILAGSLYFAAVVFIKKISGERPL